MEKKIQNATHERELKIGGIPLKIAVLEDGSRVIEAESLNNFFEAMQNDGFAISQEDSENLAKFIKGIK